MTMIRSALFDLTFYLWTIILSILALPTLVVSQRATLWISELWASVSLMLLQLIVGLSYDVRGRHNLPAGSVIVALKHQSAWDTIALWILLKHPAIVLKQSLAMIPVFGWHMKRGGAIVIDRSAGARALKPMLAAARSAVVERRPIAIFPEGTRSPVGAHGPYQPGVAALYTQLGLPIVPVALNSGLFWPRRSVLKRSGRVLVEFLPAIAPGLDRRHVVAELERRIEQATAVLVAESKANENAACAVLASPEESGMDVGRVNGHSPAVDAKRSE